MKKTHALLFLGVLLLAITISLTVRGSATAYSVLSISNSSYGPLPSQKFDACIPQTGGRVKVPAVIIIHGGAWEVGDKGDDSSVCQDFAAHGIAAFSINYRLYVPASTTTPASNTWPTQLVDSQLAVRWLRTNAAAYGVDPTKVCAYGESAGAQLALFLGSLSSNTAGDMSSTYATQSPKVSCVVDNFGLADFSKIPAWLMSAESLNDFVHYDTQGTQGYVNASPIFSVTAQTAPTLIVQGSQDGSVVPDQSASLKVALEAHNVSTQFLYYNGDHMYQGLSASDRQNILDSSVEYVAIKTGLTSSSRTSCTIKSTPTTVKVNQPFTLSWNTTGTSWMSFAITKDGQVLTLGLAGTSGSSQNGWGAPGVYRYSAYSTGINGNATCSATVTVSP